MSCWKLVDRAKHAQIDIVTSYILNNSNTPRPNYQVSNTFADFYSLKFEVLKTEKICINPLKNAQKLRGKRAKKSMLWELQAADESVYTFEYTIS